MLQKTTFHHFRRAHKANRRRNPYDDIIKQIKAKVAWRQKGSEHWEHCAAHDLKRSFRPRNNGKHTFLATKKWRHGSRIMWIERPQWQECEFKTQRQRLCMSRNILGMLKRHDRQPQSLKQHLRRYWMLSETVWDIFPVPKRRRMGKMRMKMKMIQSWQAERRWWIWLGDGHNLQNGTAPHGELSADADEAWRTDATRMGGHSRLLPWERYEVQDDWT